MRWFRAAHSAEVVSEEKIEALLNPQTSTFRRVAVAGAVCASCLVMLVALFIGLLIWTLSATRDGRIIKSIAYASQTGVLTEADFPISVYGHGSPLPAPPLPGYQYRYNGLDNDMFTECLALSTNLGNQENRSLLYRAAATPYNDPMRDGGMKPCRWLIEDIKSGTLSPEQPYFRYWHGHQIYLRPLLANTSLANVHVLNAILLIGALSSFIILMVRQFGIVAAPVLLIPLLVGTSILTTPASTVHALSWIWAFSSLTLVAICLNKHAVNATYTIALIFSFGCIAAFFDILWSPPFAPTFMGFLAIVAGLQRHKLGRSIFDAGVVVFSWFAGFSLCWISKWIFATAVLGWAVVKPSLFDAINVRSFGDPSLPETSQTILAATRIALEAHNPLLFTISLALAVSIALTAMLLDGRWRLLLWRLVALLTPLVIPIIWVEVLRGHSIGHPGFAYRSFVYFAIIPLMAALVIWPRQISQFQFGMWGLLPQRFRERKWLSEVFAKPLK
jgi:hypothetical protein